MQILCWTVIYLIFLHRLIFVFVQSSRNFVEQIPRPWRIHSLLSLQCSSMFYKCIICLNRNCEYPKMEEKLKEVMSFINKYYEGQRDELRFQNLKKDMVSVQEEVNNKLQTSCQKNKWFQTQKVSESVRDEFFLQNNNFFTDFHSWPVGVMTANRSLLLYIIGKM